MSVASTAGACGLQARVLNKGRWAKECDANGIEPVPPNHIAFDAATRLNRGKISNQHEATAGFGSEGRRPPPRKAGGCCTTLNVYECIGEEANGEPKHRDALPGSVFASGAAAVEGGGSGMLRRANLKQAEATNRMEVAQRQRRRIVRLREANGRIGKLPGSHHIPPLRSSTPLVTSPLFPGKQRSNFKSAAEAFAAAADLFAHTATHVAAAAAALRIQKSASSSRASSVRRSVTGEAHRSVTGAGLLRAMSVKTCAYEVKTLRVLGAC